MKKIILVVFMISGVLFSSAQSILNPSFEDWVTYNLGERPVFWNTSDSLTASIGAGHSAVKEATDVCDLSYAVKMTSIGLFTLTGPGVVTNGVISGNASSYTVSGGTPDTARSKFINCCLKYIPAAPGTDNAIISAFLFKSNGGSRDTIAYSINTIGTTLVMNNFSFGFHYIDFDNQPDTILIILQSSRGISDATVGSALTVDNLTLTGWVGIDDAASQVKSMKLYPIPANDELTIMAELNNPVAMHYEIMDIAGKLVGTSKMESNTEKIDISPLPAGNYFITLRDDAGKKLIADKFTIVR